MRLDELIPLVARFLKENKVAYFTFGGVGVSIWGEPRTTKDLDITVHVDRPDLPRLAAGLNDLGFRVTRSLQRKMAEGRIVQLPIGKTRLDIRMCRTRHDFDALRRALSARLGDFSLSVAMPEDIILYKLQTWRHQDKADIENLLRNARALDRSYVEAWIPGLEEDAGQPLRRRWREITS